MSRDTAGDLVAAIVALATVVAGVPPLAGLVIAVLCCAGYEATARQGS